MNQLPILGPEARIYVAGHCGVAGSTIVRALQQRD